MALNDTALNVMADHLTSLVGHLSLHSADPGAAGTLNETSAARQVPTWTAATNGGDFDLAAAVNFTGGAASGACTFVGLWSADDTTFYGSYALTGDQTFNAAGEYTVNTITETGSAS